MKKFVLLLMVILVAMMSFANDTISIVDFHSKDANSSDWYFLQGVISGIDDAGYNGQASFYLTDETGTVWGDGLSRTKESTPGLQVGELTAMGVDNGDELTIGTRCAVNDNASIAGARRLSWAYYISHKDVEGENGGNITPNDSIVTPPEPEDGITVRLASTSFAGWDNVYLYAWGDGISIGWPGEKLSKDANGWCSYTFDSIVVSANIIWNNGKGEQTVDIMGVTKSTCYTLENKGSDGKFLETVVDCATEITSYYTVTFLDWNGDVIKTEWVAKGGSATAPTAPIHEGYVFTGWNKDFSNVQSDLDVMAQYSKTDFPAEPSELELTRAEYWYDFTGTGEKGMVRSGYYYSENNTQYDYHLYTSGASNGYKAAGYIVRATTASEIITDRSSDRIFIEDVNGDGEMDIWVETTGNQFYGEGYYEVFISTPDGYKCETDMLIIPNFDVNRDGRLDYLHQKDVGWAIMEQQADGSFVEEHIQMMTLAEYENEFDPSAWRSTQPSTWSGLIEVDASGILATNAIFGGASLARAPQRHSGSSAQRAPGINNLISAPTRALDLNADGMMDLVNEKDGVIYYNVGNGKWVMSDISGAIMVADLNGDAIQDFIYPGAKLQTVIYRGEGKFDTQLLYENIQVDPDMYCYDFDKDGDVDILVTFSAPLNSTGYAYTMFFENDGTGKFTQLEEQDYGAENNLLFSNCQDVDGDGYYDMLAFRSNFTIYKGDVQCDEKEIIDVVWMKGRADKTFAQPEVLITYAVETHRGFDSHREVKINAEDIDNDGKIEVWSSGRNGWNDVSFSATIGEVAAAVNTAPIAPQKPTLIYSNGMLLVNWGDGSDAETATSDLTYALRVGTTPGGDDILRAHANADGSRRNFLDGNMGKYHSYKLDLSQRMPSVVYVSVQTIDAQHEGSAWSEEASVEHTAISAEFRLDRKEFGRGETIVATAYELPEEYTHIWQAEDGECMGDGHTVKIVFNATGTKTITHTVRATDGTRVSAVESVNVMPNYATAIETSIPSGLQDAFNEKGVNYGANINRTLADYNMDGYWDLIGSEAITYGDYLNVISKGEADYAFTRASGIWNTGLDIETAIWYDWDHNGAADVIFRTSSDNSNECYYLSHNGTNNLQAKKSDEHIAALNLDGRTTGSDDRYPAYTTNNHYPVEQFIDFTHNGYYDVYANNNNNKTFLWSRQSDGSYQAQEIIGTFDYDKLNKTFGNSTNRFHKDINRDGFTEVCALLNKSGGDTFLPYDELTVMINKGNYEFEQLIIPFEQKIAYSGSSSTDLNNPRLEDMNNDGYLDIVAARADYAIYIMWNEKNERFSAPDVLPLGELDGFYSYNSKELFVEDVDNNGYLDVVSMQQDKSAGDDVYGTYIHYFGADGVVQQGFVETYTLDKKGGLSYVFKLPNHQWTIAHYYSKNYSMNYSKLQGTTNERPSAPDGVRAVQTEDGLLIEWSDAKDDFTPAVQIQYNLSVKTKGASGAGAYIISPQNACNSNAAPMRNYDYICANQYLVPLSVLPVGEYEIQVQAIDMQGDWSEFSAPIIVAVQQENEIDAPTAVCVGNTAKFVYMGTPSSATATWDFDGAEILSGSGYGPYELVWNSVGTKTVTLTIDGNTESRMIYVEANDADIELPSTMIVGMPMTISIPIGMTAEWYMKYVDDTDYMPMNSFSKEVKIENNTITVLSAEKEEIDIMLELANANGCETVLEQRIEVVSTESMPKISHVSTNAEGKNVIYWRDSSVKFSQVRILKETNRYNQFVEIGVAEIADGEYTDMSSSAETKSERYMIQPVIDNVELPIANVHQTTHLTINRGLNDQTWNLIWNRYEGAEVESYLVFRGSSVDNMTEHIATLSGSNTSYTDITPDASAPYYAIGYVLAGDVVSSPISHAKIVKRSVSGKSNVVNVANANTLVYAEKIAILSANNQYKTTADNTMLLLYAELMPTETTYKQVSWEITSGKDLATIDKSGLLTACTPNKGGTVIVKATTLDGTNISATRNITIGAIAAEVEPTYFMVTFQDWDGTVLKTEQVEQGKSATAPANLEREGYIFIGWDKEFNNVQSDLIVTAQYKPIAGTTYFTVTFQDWDKTVLKTEQVEQGKSATAPANPEREGYIFIGWDKDFSNVQSDLIVTAQYEKETNVENTGEERVAIYVVDGVLHVENADTYYNVFDTAGRLIYTGCESVLSLPRGVYVVVVGDEVEKIVL